MRVRQMLDCQARKMRVTMRWSRRTNSSRGSFGSRTSSKARSLQVEGVVEVLRQERVGSQHLAALRFLCTIGCG